jgi:hypothetical protein
MITDSFFQPNIYEKFGSCDGDVYCGSNQYCDGNNSYDIGNCQNKKGINGKCRRNSWCDSNKCKHMRNGVGNCDL